MENAIVAGFFPGATPSMESGRLTAGPPSSLPTSSARRAPSSLPTASSRCAVAFLPTASATRARFTLSTAPVTAARFSIPTAASSSCCLSCLGRGTGSASEGTAFGVVRRGVRAASTSEATAGAEDYFCGAEGSAAVFYTAVSAEASCLSSSSCLAVPVVLAEVEVWSATDPAANPSPSCSPCPRLVRAALATEVVRAAWAPSPSAKKADEVHTATSAESRVATCPSNCTVACVAPATKASPLSDSSRAIPVILDEAKVRSATKPAANPCGCCACLLHVGPARKVTRPASTSEAAVVSPSAKEADALCYPATGAESRVLCYACGSLSVGFESATTASSRSSSSRTVPIILTEVKLWSATEPAASLSASCSHCLVRAALASAGVCASSDPSATKAHALCTATGADSRVVSCACGCACLLCLTSAAEVASISAPTLTWAASAGDTEFGVIYTATGAESRVVTCACGCSSEFVVTFRSAATTPDHVCARAASHASGSGFVVTQSPKVRESPTCALPAPFTYPGGRAVRLKRTWNRTCFLSNTAFSAFDSLNGIPRGVARTCFLTKSSSWSEKAQKRAQCSAQRGHNEGTLDWDRIARLSILCALLQKSGYFSLPPPRTAVQKSQVDWTNVANGVKMVLLISCLYVGYRAVNGNDKMSRAVDVIDKAMKAFKVVDEVTKFVK